MKKVGAIVMAAGRQGSSLSFTVEGGGLRGYGLLFFENNIFLENKITQCCLLDLSYACVYYLTS